MPRWLVTGGAGYIGSHIVHALLTTDIEPVVIDDLSTGIKSRVPSSVAFMQADIRDPGALCDAMEGCDGVIHLAGRKSVGESVDKPLAYWDANLGGTLDVLRAMRYCNVPRIVFSSTASVYAESDEQVTEEDPVAPMSPYGASKLAAERLIADYAASAGVKHAILRYFNVAGCSSSALGDTSEDNLVPRVIRALLANEYPVIFGDDYPTSDGTAVRDYVHVADLAEAHVVVARRIDSLPRSVYNLGTGRGSTVREIIDRLVEASGATVEPLVVGRRAGDPARTVANVSAAYWDTGWRARRSITDIAVSAWDSALSRV
jgi:UDP-glucose 4-epimerase